MVVLPYKGEIGFDNEKYISLETQALLERVEHFDKLYLECGGKLMKDFHAARVLPGYDTEAKIDVLRRISNKRSLEFLLVLNARFLEEERVMGSLALSYQRFALEMIKNIRKKGFSLNKAVITFFDGQKKAKAFAKLLRELGFTIYYSPYIPGYPKNYSAILSAKGFAKKPFVKTESDIVVITSPSPNSGKMATALMLVYQDFLRGRDSGYAKLETFPVWNLPLKSFINLAYEAATADIGDYNVIDPYHLRAYKRKAVNYNRDVQAFILLRKLINKITSPKNYMRLRYKSPTDMGVNKIREAISDLSLCENAARDEIIRRYFRYKVMFHRGKVDPSAYKRVESIMRKAKISVNDRDVVKAAKEGAALQVGKNLYLSFPSSFLLPQASVFVKFFNLKTDFLAKVRRLYKAKEMLYSKEEKRAINSMELLLLAFSYTSANPLQLFGAELHSKFPLTEEEERFLLELGINATWEL